MDKERHESVAADENNGNTARRGRQDVARFIEMATDSTIAGNGTRRLCFATRTVDKAGAPLRTDSERIKTRQTLHRLAEALPHLLDQTAGSSTGDQDTERGTRNKSFAGGGG